MPDGGWETVLTVIAILGPLALTARFLLDAMTKRPPPRDTDEPDA